MEVDIRMRNQKIEAQIPDGEIVKTEWMKSGTYEQIPGIYSAELPEHTRVHVVCRPEESSKIRIEIWLPENWNGDFVGTGNGGAAGVLAHISMFGPLQMGFAVANTDLGTSKGADSGIGNPAIWKDFGYRATHLMTLAAKEVIHSFYGKYPMHSYFVGGSTGGQQALMEAQRYPEDYDGILAGAPANDRTNLHIGFLWDWLAVNRLGTGMFTVEDAKKIANLMLEQYGGKGERREGDPFFYRPDRIEIKKEVFENSGLKKEQVDALMKIYAGVKDPVTGEVIHGPLLMPGSEAEDMGLVARSDEKQFATDFFYLFRWIFGVDFDFKKFDFHRDTEKVHKMLDPYLNANESDLTAFKNRGGKLLLIHGTADPIIPCTESISYYEKVCNKMGDVGDFFRLFLVPGMAHIGGGPGLQDILFGFPATPRDARHLGLLALKEWVETERPPMTLCPVAFAQGDPLAPFRKDGVAWEREIACYESENKEENNDPGKLE